MALQQGKTKMMKRGLFRRLAGDRRGAMAMIVALSTPVLIGGVGMTVDVIQWSYMKRAMQRQADSGAIAGAFAVAAQGNVSDTVTADLARNNNVVLTSAPVIENGPSAGPYAGNTSAVRVALATDVKLSFVGYIMRRAINIPVEATAALVAQGDYCVLALERNDLTGITMGGNTVVNLGCGLMSNAPAADSVTGSGSSTISATPISAVGGLPPSGNYAANTELIPYAVAQPDPYGDLPDPVLSAATVKFKDKPNGQTTINPGVYSDMNIQGNVKFNPGTYYVDGGSFSVGSQANVSGNGVTIIMTSRTAATDPGSIATADMNGGATVNLTAPTSGEYAGVLFYQDRRALDSGSNKINGNSSSKFQGAIYFPSQKLWFNGTSGVDIKCVQMVARRIEFNGNAVITNICPDGSGSGSFKGTRVKLVA